MIHLIQCYAVTISVRRLTELDYLDIMGRDDDHYTVSKGIKNFREPHVFYVFYHILNKMSMTIITINIERKSELLMFPK